MTKPRITLHIFSSLDGRITGSFGRAKAAAPASRLFSRIGFSDSPDSFHFDGWIYGKNTSIEGFGNQLVTGLDDQVEVPDGDYPVSLGADRYYIAIDPRGEIGWTKSTATYAGQSATVIEIITSQVGAGYRNYLRRHRIPYLIAGKEEVNFDLMLEKLNRDYGLSNLMLGGGGVLNWSFLDQGLVDEISIVMAPAVDGATNTARLFNACYQGDAHPISFRPIALKSYDSGTLWVRYRPVYE